MYICPSESYPDLKANQNMANLQEELSSTENKVAFSRQAFNDLSLHTTPTNKLFLQSSSPVCSVIVRTPLSLNLRVKKIKEVFKVQF